MSDTPEPVMEVSADTKSIDTHMDASQLNCRLAINRNGDDHYRVVTVEPDQRTPPKLVGWMRFQKGPVKEVGGVNGLSIEALLAIAQDQLELHESGPLPNVYNQEALGGIKTAMRALRERTENRIRRQVEGTSEK